MTFMFRLASTGYVSCTRCAHKAGTICFSTSYVPDMSLLTHRRHARDVSGAFQSEKEGH